MKTIRSMLHSRPSRSPFALGIRTILALLAFWVVALGCGTFVTLVVAASTMATYFALAAVSRSLSKTRATEAGSSFSSTLRPIPTLQLMAVCFLAMLVVWHVTLYLIFELTYLATFWHTPVLGVINIARIEHAVLAAFSLTLITSYVCRAYVGERFSRRDCFDTAALLNLLFASHFTIP